MIENCVDVHTLPSPCNEILTRCSNEVLLRYEGEAMRAMSIMLHATEMLKNFDL